MSPPPIPRPPTLDDQVRALARRVDDLERHAPTSPGQYSSAGPIRSVFPPAGKPNESGSWNVKPEYWLELQKQVDALHAAREDAEKKAALAEAKAQGANEARMQQLKDAADAKAAAAETDNRRIRNLKLVLAILAAFATLGPCLAWCASEAKHAAADVAVPAHH